MSYFKPNIFKQFHCKPFLRSEQHLNIIRLSLSVKHWISILSKKIRHIYLELLHRGKNSPTSRELHNQMRCIVC